MADDANSAANPAENNAEELAPTQTAGYKAPEKKTLAELEQLDQNDESLKKWKESLLAGAKSAEAAKDPRRVVVMTLAMEVEGRSDVTLKLEDAKDLEKLKDTPIIIKEGTEYRMKVAFRVQHDVVSGLKYLHVVKRKGIRVDKLEEMIGSYGPNPEPYTKKFQLEQAPSGMLARGHYVVKSRFIDDDGVSHLEWEWSFDIKKDWDANSD